MSAQQPICPSPGPQQLYYTACRPQSALVVARFLSDFTVDHLFKPSPPPFERSLLQFMQPLVGPELIANEVLVEHLEPLAPVRFTQLDGSTGVFVADFEDAERVFDAPLDLYVGNFRLSARLPERLEGGYWRTPGVLEMAFWERKRVAFTAELLDGQELTGEIECLSLSRDGLRLMLSGRDAPSVMISFRGC